MFVIEDSFVSLMYTFLSQIFSKPSQKEDWFDDASSRFIPKLISMVRGQVPLDVKYAACCVFRALSQYEDFIMYVTEEILPAVLQMRNSSAKFKV